MDLFSAISLAGGVALFLYGMTIMGAGLEKVAGGRMQSILQKLTSSTLRGILLGTFITAIIQSSAGTIVIVIGLVNSGIMALPQAVGVIMGANIGTTVTGQLIRLADISGDSLFLRLIQPRTFAPVVAFVGMILYVFIKAPKKRNIGQIMMGFGILFTGMFEMDAAVAGLKESQVFIDLFTRLENPFLGLLAGLAVTVVIQSSSASVGILQALSSTGVVTWGNALPIILGAHVGTTFTPILASAGASKNAKRSAMIHLYFNVISSAVFLLAATVLNSTVGLPFWHQIQNKGSIANIHTLSSLLGAVLFIPFSRLLLWLANITIPDKGDEAMDEELPVLDERLFKSPSVAIQQAHSAVGRMARNARLNYGVAIPLLYSHDTEQIAQVNAREDVVDKLEYYIGNYLVKISHREITEGEGRTISDLLAYITDFERIGDYAINVVERSGEIFDKEIVFSELARQELGLLDGAVKEIIQLAEDAFRHRDPALAAGVEPLEETIDDICALLHNRHIERLQNGLCAIESGVVYLEILTNLERIADHCSNIAARVIGSETEDDDFDPHEMRRRMHDGYVEEYNARRQGYEQKYLLPIREVE